MDDVFVNATGSPLNLAAGGRDQVELHIFGFDSGQANNGFALRVFIWDTARRYRIIGPAQPAR